MKEKKRRRRKQENNGQEEEKKREEETKKREEGEEEEGDDRRRGVYRARASLGPRPAKGSSGNTRVDRRIALGITGGVQGGYGEVNIKIAEWRCL